MVNIGNSWDEILREEFQKDYYIRLRRFLISEYNSKTIYPDMNHIFSAFKETAYEDVKAVILGQDPYHEPGQAHGMAFSVLPGVPQPPSLVNIFKELQEDLGIEPPPRDYGYLMKWAKEGVLLLNTCLTVREHKANSHKGQGWELFTDRVIEKLSAREKPMVFILWGNNARNKRAMIDGRKHLILEGPHPSPLSAYSGFFGGDYFSRTNDFLMRNDIKPIDWRIDGTTEDN